MITINGGPITTFAQGKQVILFSTQLFLESNTVYNIVIRAGAIRGNNGQLTTEDFTLTFKTTDDLPKFVSSNPLPGSTIYYDSYEEVEDKFITLKFNRPVTLNRNLLNGIEGSPDRIFGITSNPEDSTITVLFQTSYPLVGLGITINEGAVIDSNGNQNSESTTIAFQTAVR